MDRHAGSSRGHAGSHEPAGFFVFHQTETTGAVGCEIRMIAKRRDMDAVLPGSQQNAGIGRACDFLTVNLKNNGFHKQLPLLVEKVARVMVWFLTQVENSIEM